MLRAGDRQDFDFLKALSHGVTDEALLAQIRDGRLSVVGDDGGAPIGLLKFCLLWETLPFIEVLMIAKAHQKKGHGTGAFRAWEVLMKDRGFELVLTSTQADETAQHFWRKLGYWTAAY